MSLYLGDSLISQLYVGTTAANTTNITLSTPTLSVNSSTGVVTATVTQSNAGYLVPSSTSNTLQLTTQAAATITPTAASQTAVAVGKYTIGEVAVAAVPTETKTVTSNGTYSPTSGKFFSSVTVNVPVGSTINNQDKTVTPTTSSQSVSADYGYTGLGLVTVNAIPSQYIIPTGSQTVTTNDTYDVTNLASLVVNVPVGSTINNQAKTATPTESQQEITADSGYTGLSKVTISAISSTYVGSGITRRSSTDLTASGATVTIPAGYYTSQATKTITSGTAGTPTATKGTVSNNSISVTPSVTNTTGYITGGTKTGTAVTVSASELVSGNKAITSNGTGIDVTNYATVSVDVPTGGGGITPTGTINITTNGSHDVTNYATASVNITPVLQTKTATPTESSQTISPDSGYDGLSSVTVNAISSTYVGSGIARKTSADLVFISNDNLLDPNSTVINAYIAAATGKLTSSSPDRAVIVPIAINTEYTFTWNRTALTGDSDDFSIGIFSSYPTIGSIGRWVGASLATSGSVSRTFTTTSGEHYIAIKLAHSTKTDFNQTLADSTLYATSGNVISAPSGYYANGAFTTVPTETKSITVNGTYTPSTGKLISSVTVNVPTGSTINNQNKTVNPTTAEQQITADSGYTGLGTVTVTAMPTMTLPTAAAASATSGFTSKATISRSASDQYINIPTGYNSAGAYYKISAVANGSATTPATTITADPTISVNSSGLITASASATQSVTPTVSAGYVSSGTAGTITVSGSKTLQLTTQAAKTVTPTTSSQTAVASGVYTTGAITVAAIPSQYIVPSGNKAITANGTGIDVTSFATVSVAVPATTPTLQSKTVTPTESVQTITADSGYDGLDEVEVEAISTTYVGSGITSRSSTDLTVSGATVTAPAGYYASAASKSVATMTLPTAATSSATSGYTSKATISRSTSDQYINIPTGYNSAGGYYKISAVANGSVTAPSTISGTSATVSTGTNTLTLTKTISVTPNVTTAGYISSGTAGNSSVSLTASVTTKAAATITPGTTNQTIASGTYLTGTQTIAGDSDLTAANIKTGVQIFNVTGSFTSDATATAADINSGITAYVNGNKITGTQTFSTIHTGSSAPSSSIGANGDVYLVLV